MPAPGDVISYPEMCQTEGASLQRGMNFRLNGGVTVVLMSRRRGAPYSDRIEDEGRTLIYEGHDVPRVKGGPSPKSVDQPTHSPGGRPTQNKMFFDSVAQAKRGERPAESVRVYEKLREGVWVFDGVFSLVDAWQETSGGRKVFRFKLISSTDTSTRTADLAEDLPHNRLIPPAVKLEVWKRDKGRCVLCGSDENLHFDHIIPYSRGGSSLVSKNIQLLCAKHNLQKHDKIL